MTANSVEPLGEWDHCGRFDWQVWTSWRALIASAIVVGLMGATAALVGELAVREVFGMTLGRKAFGGPDLLAIAIAIAVLVPLLLIWIHNLQKRHAEGLKRLSELRNWSGGMQRRPTWFVAPVFILCTLAVSLFIFVVGTKLIGSAEIGQPPAFVIVTPMLTVTGASLHAGLMRFGAKPFSTDQAAR